MHSEVVFQFDEQRLRVYEPKMHLGSTPPTQYHPVTYWQIEGLIGILSKNLMIIVVIYPNPPLPLWLPWFRGRRSDLRCHWRMKETAWFWFVSAVGIVGMWCLFFVFLGGAVGGWGRVWDSCKVARIFFFFKRWDICGMGWFVEEVDISNAHHEVHSWKKTMFCETCSHLVLACPKNHRIHWPSSGGTCFFFWVQWNSWGNTFPQVQLKGMFNFMSFNSSTSWVTPK